jgi:hypothetical protein
MNQIDKSAIVTNDEITLKNVILQIQDWWKYLLSKWIIIFLAGIIGAVIGLTYAFTKKPVYNASLSFAMEDEKGSGGLGGALGLASQFGFDIGSSSSGAFSGDNLLELMKSRLMVQSTLLAPIIINHKKQTLAELYISFNKLREKWSDDPQLRDIHFLPGANPVKFSLKQDSILGVFYGSLIKKNLSVDKIDKKLSIITISVNSENEVFSKYFTEILAKTVSDFYKEIKTKKSVQNVAILQRQTDSVRIGLNQALNGVATSVDNNPNANPALQILKVPSQRRQVDVQVNSAALTELVKNLEIAKI